MIRMNGTITPLHVRSGYSLLRGPTLLPRLVEAAASQGHRRIALTDVNGLCGATQFHRLAAENGLGAILGAELQVGRQAAVALVAGDGGYENLCRIITRIRCRAGTALAGALAELSGGLHLIVEDARLAEDLLSAGADRRRLWLGLDVPTQTATQVMELLACADRAQLGLVATGKAFALEPGQRDVARTLAAVRLGATCDALTAGDLPHRRALLRSPARLAADMADFPEAMVNNQRLADACSHFHLLPRRAVFPDFGCPGGLSARAYLRRLCREGLRRRYGDPPGERVEGRLETELRLIERLGFAEYFLVVWDIVQYARRQGAPVAGRGSGGSSIVAYALGITNVCPLANDIPFERFLHEGRSDFPDLDIDFCWRIRDDVIDYAFRRWGHDRVAMVCSYNTFQPRSALRETAKAAGLSDTQITRFFDGKVPVDDRWRRVAGLSRRLIGLPRLLSVHPGGIVIGRKPIDHYVPIQPAAKGVTIAQYDKEGVKAIRLVKLDLLGNRTLSTIRYACDLVRRSRGAEIDIEALPPDDPATLRLLRAAETVGCNQLESPAMRHLLRALRPGGLRDVMKALALIRPGAASIGMKEAFIRRHRGLDAVPRGNPQVDAMLAGTCGVMLYEDDVMLVAAALLGSCLAEADRFRKAVQNCRSDAERLDLSRRFLSRCVANGVETAYAKLLWQQMAKFNAYSFCRAHAASYAALAYAGAYLKAHYPLEFWTAALNNNQSMYPPRVYVEQARRAGVRFLLPDANRSAAEFSIDDGSIRAGLGHITNLGSAAVEVVLAARADRPFAGLSDLLCRTRLGRQEARSLILSGALDFTGRSRPTLMMELNLFLAVRPGPAYRQRALLGLAGPNIPNVPGDYTPLRKYVDERTMLGFSVRDHIMSLYRPWLAGLVDVASRDLPGLVGRRVRIAGVLETRRTAQTRRDETMMFLTFDDEDGLFEATVFPDACRRLSTEFTRYGPYVVAGRVEEQYDSITVTAESIRPADQAQQFARAVRAAFEPDTTPDGETCLRALEQLAGACYEDMPCRDPR